jgi:predicted nuclease of predicted toxin-antitoxin system
VRWLADENLNKDIVRGSLRRKPDLDMVKVQDVGMSGTDDPSLLAWAASQDRVLITHDGNTMTAYAYRRTAAGEHMPGVFEVGRSVQLRSPSRTSCW